MDAGGPAPLDTRGRVQFPASPAPLPPEQHDRMHSKFAKLHGVLHARVRVRERHIPVNGNKFKMSGTRGSTHGNSGGGETWTCCGSGLTRTVDTSSNSTDPDPKRLKPTTATDVESSEDQMDEHTSLRTLATSHPFEPDAEQIVSKKA